MVDAAKHRQEEDFRREDKPGREDVVDVVVERSTLLLEIEQLPLSFLAVAVADEVLDSKEWIEPKLLEISARLPWEETAELC